MKIEYLGYAFLIAVVALVGWVLTIPKLPASEIVSTSGIHWHPHLAITINGKNFDIPKGIGLGAVEQPIHTHEADGIIHLEYQTPGQVVKKEDTLLSKFFTIWDKKFSRDCIFEYCTTPASTSTIKFIVNGTPNELYENYPMKDGDKIEIKYE